MEKNKLKNLEKSQSQGLMGNIFSSRPINEDNNFSEILNKYSSPPSENSNFSYENHKEVMLNNYKFNPISNASSSNKGKETRKIDYTSYLSEKSKNLSIEDILDSKPSITSFNNKEMNYSMNEKTNFEVNKEIDSIHQYIENMIQQINETNKNNIEIDLNEDGNSNNSLLIKDDLSSIPPPNKIIINEVPEEKSEEKSKSEEEIGTGTIKKRNLLKNKMLYKQFEDIFNSQSSR